MIAFEIQSPVIGSLKLHIYLLYFPRFSHVFHIRKSKTDRCYCDSVRKSYLIEFHLHGDSPAMAVSHCSPISKAETDQQMDFSGKDVDF